MNDSWPRYCPQCERKFYDYADHLKVVDKRLSPALQQHAERLREAFVRPVGWEMIYGG